MRLGELRSGKVRCGEAWLGLAVEAWQGRVRYGRVVRGLAVEDWPGTVGSGWAR